jgi:hypothetical protein
LQKNASKSTLDPAVDIVVLIRIGEKEEEDRIPHTITVSAKRWPEGKVEVLRSLAVVVMERGKLRYFNEGVAHACTDPFQTTLFSLLSSQTWFDRSGKMHLQFTFLY